MLFVKIFRRKYPYECVVCICTVIHKYKVLCFIEKFEILLLTESLRQSPQYKLQNYVGQFWIIQKHE